MAKEQEKKQEPPKPKIYIPTQKTFVFGREVDEEEIDKKINEWLRKKTEEGQPPMLGKVSSNHATGKMYYVFMLTKIEDKK